MQMVFHEHSAALVVLWAHLKEEALDSKFLLPVKSTAISEDLNMGQTDEAAASYIPTLFHLCPPEKQFSLSFVLPITLANKFLIY